MIAGFLVRECAVVTAQEQTLETAMCGSLFDLSHNVYTRYRVVDGVRYVASLQNSRSGTRNEEELLFDAQNNGMVRKLIIVEDHLGVRLVHFSSEIATGQVERHGTPGHLPRAWWRAIHRPGGFTKIRAKGDVCNPSLISNQPNQSLEHQTPRSSRCLQVRLLGW